MAVKVYSSVGNNFRRLIEDRRDQAKVAAASVLSLAQPQWMAPSNWDGNPVTDVVEKMAATFDRTEENQMMVDATSDISAPGVGLDCWVPQLQVDSIASFERAFRRRHLTRCRSIAQAAGRHQFQGEAAGLFERGMMGAVEDILAQGRVSAESTGSLA